MLKYCGWLVTISILVAFFAFPGSSIEAGEGNVLRVGEVLTYKIYYGSIPAGSQTLKVVEKTEYQGREVYRIQMEMGTASAVGMLYSYKETEEILIDAKEFYPLHTIRHVKKKRRRITEETTFSLEKKEIVVRTVQDGEETVKIHPMEKPSQTGLSLYYYLRTRPWESGKRELFLLTRKGVETFPYITKKANQYKTAVGTFDVNIVENTTHGYILRFSQEDSSLLLQVEVGGKFDSRLVKVD